MSFAELILRIGVTFVSWMMIYMHLVMMLVVRIGQCPGGDVSPWQVTMVTGILAFGSSFTALYGHGVSGMKDVFRYFTLPLIVLLPWAMWLSLPYLTETTFGALHVCDVRLAQASGMTVPGWQRIWAPLQLAVLLTIAINGWRAWRPDNHERA